MAFREINAHVRDRLTQHLRRRSQRPFRPPEGVTYYEQIQRLGWCACSGWQPRNCLRMPETIRFQESRMSGNPLVRFDEGRVGRTSVSPSLLLYREIILARSDRERRGQPDRRCSLSRSHHSRSRLVGIGLPGVISVRTRKAWNACRSPASHSGGLRGSSY
jgi:hypothetical protein